MGGHTASRSGSFQAHWRSSARFLCPAVRVPLYVLLALGGGDSAGCGFWTEAPVQARLSFFFFPPGVHSPEGLPKMLGKWLTGLLAARRLLGVQFADEAAVHPVPSCRIRISTALNSAQPNASEPRVLLPSPAGCARVLVLRLVSPLELQRVLARAGTQ